MGIRYSLPDIEKAGLKLAEGQILKSLFSSSVLNSRFTILNSTSAWQIFFRFYCGAATLLQWIVTQKYESFIQQFNWYSISFPIYLLPRMPALITNFKESSTEQM